MNIIKSLKEVNFMTGSVKFINSKRGMVAVQIDSGDFTIFEILGSCEVNLGDEIVGKLDSLGSETLYNRTINERFEEGKRGRFVCRE